MSFPRMDSPQRRRERGVRAENSQHPIGVPPVEEAIYEREIKVATELARQAGAVLLEHYYSPFLVEQKVNALDELEEVTAADREANELIVNRLQKELH